MFRSFLMGLVGGQRAMTPLAAVAAAAARGELPADNGAPKLLARPLVAAGALALAAAELAGDKMPSAPDRTVPAGLIGRTLTSAVAGAALETRAHRLRGAAIGAATAIAVSFLGLAARKRAMRRFGQTASGFAEDALVLGAATAIVRSGRAR